MPTSASAWLDAWILPHLGRQPVQTATGRHANLSSLNKASLSHGLGHTYVSWTIDEDYTAGRQ